MFKNVYLSAACALFSVSMSAQSVDRITSIQDTLDHIGQEKTAIMLETKTALLLMQTGESHFRQTLQDQYESTRQVCISLLNAIIASTEFTTTLDQVTDEQAILIVDQMVKFNDIIIDPTVYPLEKKLNKELALAAFDEQTEQLFNVCYLVYATIRGSKILLEKLELKSQELAAELEALQNSLQA